MHSKRSWTFNSRNDIVHFGVYLLKLNDNREWQCVASLNSVVIKTSYDKKGPIL